MPDRSGASLYVDVSGSTEKYWRLHRNAIRAGSRPFYDKWMFGNVVMTWDGAITPNFGTNLMAVIAHAKSRGRKKVIIVTDDTRMPLPDRDIPWVEYTTFEAFFNLPITEISDLQTEIDRLSAELSDLLDNTDSYMARNRHGVELHMKLEKAADALAQLKANAKAADKPALERARKSLHAVTERLLETIFGIDPSALKKENPRVDILPNPDRLHFDEMETFVSTDVAVAKLTVGGRVYEATAKRDPRDKPNETIGLTLAIGRAVRKAGNDLIRQANEAVAVEDKARRQEKAAKDQAHAEQRKAERKVRREADEKAELTRLRRDVRILKDAVDEQILYSRGLQAVIAKRDEQERARRARARKATAARKTTKAKATVKKR